jgi:carbon monoxide dehydrogenase subunit G
MPNGRSIASTCPRPYLGCNGQGLISMDMTGERRIPAPRQVVWEALNDTATLQASIPGCQSLEKTGENQMKAVATVKVGPISARFNGAVTLSDIDPPNGYTITGEGQGGVAGFAKGGAKVLLTDDDTNGLGATLLKYEVNAQVGGKLAQLGARLIDATAKQMAEQFFTKFSDEVQKFGAPEYAEAVASAPAEVMPQPAAVSPLALMPREPLGLPVMGWIGIAVFVVMVLLVLASML